MKLTYPQISAIYIIRSLGLNTRGRVTVQLAKGRGIQYRVLLYLELKRLLKIHNKQTESEFVILTSYGVLASDCIRTAVEEARSQGKGSDQKLIASESNKLLANL